MSAPPAATRPKRLRAALTAIGALVLAALILALVLGRVSFDRAGENPAMGSGVAAHQARSLPPFTGVVLTGDNNVIVAVGSPQSVVVNADRNLLARVTTRVRSGRLEIGTTPGNLTARSPMFVTVSVPSLDRLKLAGTGNITATEVDSPSLTVDLPGDGNIEASGTAAKLELMLGGAGTARLRGLIARDATASLSGDGTIMVTATRSLTANLSGTGTILYDGDPSKLTRLVSGSGTISAG